MAWDTERTKQLLLDAGTQEFSAHGLAGARIDRIAATAGVNKERIYQYFGKKEEFFGAVLESELTQVMDAVSLEGTGVEAVVDYAGRIFDYQREHPALPRLMFWEGMELGAPVAEESRARRCRRKIDNLTRAIPGIDRQDAREMLLTILTLVDSWEVLPNADCLFSGTQRRDDARHAARRSFILLAVEAMTRAVVERSVPSETSATD